jgi:hypothetical protein
MYKYCSMEILPGFLSTDDSTGVVNDLKTV